MVTSAMEKSDMPILFLGGHRKCGTTLLLNMLDGHPDFSTYPQDINTLYAYFPQFIAEEYSDKDRLARLDRVIFQDLADQLSTSRQMSPSMLKVMRDYFFKTDDKFDSSDMAQVITRQMKCFEYANEQKNTRWAVAKETSSEIYAGDLFTWFPNAKMIQIIRDPRDNYAALKAGVSKYYSRFGDDNGTVLCSMINRYVHGLQVGITNRDRFGLDRYMTLRFEDLVSDPKNEINKVMSFLGTDFSPALLTPTILGQSTSGNNHDGEQLFSISAANVGRWKERISETEAQVIEFHFGSLMQEYGYPLCFSPAQRADAAAQLYQFSNYKYYYFDRFADN